jgi:hypothetical protein
MIELWRNAVGYEGFYQVSNLGRVRSMDRWIERSTGRYFKKGQLMTPQLTRNGYYVVRIWNENGKRTTEGIHRLVAKAFISNPDDKPEVNHKDLDKSNNVVDNLEWSTRSENMKHATKSGVVNLGNLVKSKSILTDEEIISIRKRRADGERRGLVYKDYECKISLEGFKNVWYGHVSKNIKIEGV